MERKFSSEIEKGKLVILGGSESEKRVESMIDGMRTFIRGKIVRAFETNARFRKYIIKIINESGETLGDTRTIPEHFLADLVEKEMTQTISNAQEIAAQQI